MYNQPVNDSTRYSIGPGIIYLGPVGSTPSVDVGALRGNATITLNREKVEIRQGSPQTLQDCLIKQEDAMIEFTGIEWNLDRLAQVLMDGATSLSGAQEIFKVGGRPNANKWALRFVHKMADGGTIDVSMWKVLGEGKIAIGVNSDDVHQMPYKFTAIDPGSTDWAGAALSDGQKLVKIVRTKA